MTVLFFCQANKFIHSSIHSLLPDHAFGTVFLHMSVDLIYPWTPSATNWKRFHCSRHQCFQALRLAYLLTLISFNGVMFFDYDQRLVAKTSEYFFLSFFRLVILSRYCFCRRLCVCLSVCVSVRTKSRKLLIRSWCNLVGICPKVNNGSVWKLVTFDLDLWPWELFSYFFQLTLYLSNGFT